MEFIYDYGLFLAKAITLVIALVVVLVAVVGVASRQKPGKGQLEIVSITEQLNEVKHYAHSVLLDKAAQKMLAKEQKKEAKQKKRDIKDHADETKSRLFVVDFVGSMDAHEVDRLREEITAILSIAAPQDEVLVRLESGGGVVHGYGLAASQLQRIKEKGLKLTIAVDKVAASGGYMMACVADHLLSARFAYIGSIGVLAQIPNVHKLLKKHDVDFEQHTAGDYKRTLTVFGENTEEGREKFKQDLQSIHKQFKDWVQSQREKLNIDQVATGEVWLGSEALEKGLVDELMTSDDYIMSHHPAREIYAVKYSTKKNMAEKLGISVSTAVERSVTGLLSKARFWF
ncbi:protease SohB [Aestuariibacter sp. A3R04]|uniref:protease SohB n=1 Tax=Aestuariibacter sp. A3R04 TaxID=2841571 RepID=UPI001C08C21A|nr:protease SohB [Aestuariibacter sp. A3R04]MBU3022964.1 protease SohB [Aestuariibacter sp. A3R04]